MRRIGTWMLGLALVLQADGASAQPAEPKPVVDARGDPLPPGASLRLGTVAFRHRFSMPSLAFAPNGKTVASPDNDHVNVWEIATGKLVRAVTLAPPAPGSEWRFRDVAFSPDGSLLLASVGILQSDGTELPPSRVFVWDAASGRFQRALNRAFVNGFCFCGDSRTIAIAERLQISLWDVTTGRQTRDESPLPDGVLKTIAFVPRSKQLVTGDEEGRIRFWKLAGLEMGDSFELMTPVNALAASPDGKFVAQAGAKMILWDVVAGKLSAKLHYGDVVGGSVAFSPDGTLLASCHDFGDLVVWDVPSVKKRLVIRNSGWNRETHLQFSPDSKVLACGGQDGALRFWDPRTGKRLHATDGHEGAVTMVTFSPGGDRLASGAGDRTVRVWDTSSGKEIRRHEEQYGMGIAWSPDGSKLATSGTSPSNGKPGNNAQLWDAKSGKPLRESSDAGHLWSVAFSAEGKIVEIGSDCELRWRDPQTDRIVGRCKPMIIPVRLTLLRDGRHAVITGWDTPVSSLVRSVVVWDLVANRRLRALVTLEPTGNFLFVAAISPDEKHLATGCPPLKVYDLPEAKSQRTLDESNANLYSVAFAPSGKILACGRDKETFELWDVASGQKIATQVARQGKVESLDFSPDGRTLATGGADGTVLVWRLHDLLAGDAQKTDVETLWLDLQRTDDVRRAYRAIERLAGRPDESLPLFRERLKPRSPVPPERLARMFADLDDDDFATREQATRDVIALGELVEFDLKKLQRETSSPEVVRRAAGILERLAKRSPADERALRAVLALEAIDGPEAIRLLEELGRGAPGAALTLEARAATERIARRRRASQ
jgi:WD40 repeat protein